MIVVVGDKFRRGDRLPSSVRIYEKGLSSVAVASNSATESWSHKEDLLLETSRKKIFNFFVELGSSHKHQSQTAQAPASSFHNDREEQWEHFAVHCFTFSRREILTAVSPLLLYILTG